MQILPPALTALSAYAQFIVYVLKPNKNNPNKMAKQPIDYCTGTVSNPLNPEIWTDFNTASKVAAALGKNYGVGFVLTEKDPFFLLDVDGCSVDGKIFSPLAVELVQALPNAAVEISTSGRGIHIIGSGKPPAHSCRNDKLNLEFYSEKRFIALTGASTSGDVSTNCANNLVPVIEKYFTPTANVSGINAWTTEARADWVGPENDNELIARMMRATSNAFSGKAALRDLWNNDAEILAANYPPSPNSADPYNRSSVDAALMQHLAFWTGCNADRMERLAFHSQLVREKWERPGYLKTTIQKACAQQKDVLCDKKIEEPNSMPTGKNDVSVKPRLITGNTFAGVAEQLELFAGCVYVEDTHTILVPGGDMLKPDQFRVRYGGYMFMLDTRNDKTTNDAWKAYTESRALRPRWAHSSVFRPDLPPGELVALDGRTYANRYWPIPVKRVQGDPTPFLNHMRAMTPDDNDREYLISFGAACAQFPGVKFKWAPVIQGVEGNGKSLFTKCVAEAIGWHYCFLPMVKGLDNDFNAWQQDKVLIGIEDIFRADYQNDLWEALKPMISESRRQSQAKYGEKKMSLTCCNFIINTNHKDGLRKTRNDRRLAIFYTAQQSIEDLARDGLTEDYFIEYVDWLENRNGYAIVAEFLLTYKIPRGFDPRYHARAPVTTSTEAALHESLSSIEQEIMEAIEQGEVGFRGGWVSSMFLDKLLDKLKATRRVPPNRRRDLMLSLGYDWHPALPGGRVNNLLLPDNGKPRLFIKNMHASRELTVPSDIARAYTKAQTL